MFFFTQKIQFKYVIKPEKKRVFLTKMSKKEILKATLNTTQDEQNL